MQFSRSSSSSQKEIFGIYNLGGALWEESHGDPGERGSIRRREPKKSQVTSLPGHAHARAQPLEGLVRFPYRFRFEDG